MNTNEVVTSPEVVELRLRDAQMLALAAMDKDARKISELCTAAVSARIKADFKRFRDGAEKEIEADYDKASRRGAKFEMEKSAHVKFYMAEVDNIFREL